MRNSRAERAAQHRLAADGAEEQVAAEAEAGRLGGSLFRKKPDF